MFFCTRIKKTRDTIITSIFISLIELQWANFDLNSNVGIRILEDITIQTNIIEALPEVDDRADKFFNKMMDAVWKDVEGSIPLMKSFGMVTRHAKDHPNLTGTLVLAKSISPILDLIEVLDGRARSIVDDAIAS